MMTEIMRQTLASQARSVSYCKRKKTAIAQSVNSVTRVRDDSFLGTLWAHTVAWSDTPRGVVGDPGFLR